jgi:hypothetical protein
MNNKNGENNYFYVFARIHWGIKGPAKAEGTTQEKLPVFRKTRSRIKTHTLNFCKST